MENVSVERFCIFALFGASLALFAWRVIPKNERPPASITTDEVPDPPPELIWQDPEDHIGVSHQMEVPVNVPWYKATNPNARPAMGARPVVAV